MLILSFIVGAAIGSFLNVVIYRLPEEGQSIVFPGSHCPGCGKSIKWYDNIPIISFFLLRARCRYCKIKISWQYPMVELAMALFAAALFYRFSLSPSLFIYFVFVAALVVVIFIDFHHMIIPDVISLSGIALGFGLSFVNPLVTWQQSGLGILLGGGSLYLIAASYYLVTKREGMGGGDIKLLAMIGAFLGWQSLPFVVFSSSVLGAVAGFTIIICQRNKGNKAGKTAIPYGPFLSIGSIFYLFFQEKIHEFILWYFFPT